MFSIPRLRSRKVRRNVKIFVVAAGLAWCGSGPVNTSIFPMNNQMARDRQEKFEGQAKQAKVLIGEIMQSNPPRQQLPLLCLWQSRCCQATGDADGEIDAATRGLAEAPDDADLVACLVTGLSQRGTPTDLARARSTLETRLKAGTDRPQQRAKAYDYQRMLASVRYQQGDFAGARVALDAAGKLAPWAGKTFTRLACQDEAPAGIPVNPNGRASKDAPRYH
jgi:ATP/maltotriose-dependent transcriptional regulator MalT